MDSKGHKEKDNAWNGKGQTLTKEIVIIKKVREKDDLNSEN